MFDVLHWVKAAFKKNALDEIKEIDCLNKEAFRCVYATYLSLTIPEAVYADCTYSASAYQDYYSERDYS